MKGVDESEYEHHQMFYNHGIKTPEIVLLKLLAQIEKLHNMEYLHGDLNPTNNPTNVIVSEDDLYLLDFEFSAEIWI